VLFSLVPRSGRPSDSLFPVQGHLRPGSSLTDRFGLGG
jgi:hypothetical protein